MDLHSLAADWRRISGRGSRRRPQRIARLIALPLGQTTYQLSSGICMKMC